jgi:nucleotide-binding universal stress UspA family protein
MYKTILLAYDGTLEGALALREGALLAKTCGAKVVLLSVVPNLAGVAAAEGTYGSGADQQVAGYKDLLKQAVAWLQERGIEPVAKIAMGEPAPIIGKVAKEFTADLVVVGHHRKNFLSRWWSGSTNAYLSDIVGCSLLVACNPLSDDAFEAAARESG